MMVISLVMAHRCIHRFVSFLMDTSEYFLMNKCSLRHVECFIRGSTDVQHLFGNRGCGNKARHMQWLQYDGGLCLRPVKTRAGMPDVQAAFPHRGLWDLEPRVLGTVIFPVSFPGSVLVASSLWEGKCMGRWPWGVFMVSPNISAYVLSIWTSVTGHPAATEVGQWACLL